MSQDGGSIRRAANVVEPSAITPSEELQRARRERLLCAWKTPEGRRYWSEVNTTAVGLWYTAASFLFFLFGGVLALLIRIQVAVPGNQFLSAETYNQVFTVHGSVMMFLFAIPIFESIAVIFLPRMLGARDLPFPRLSAFGFWCFLLGGLFLLGGVGFDGVGATLEAARSGDRLLCRAAWCVRARCSWWSSAHCWPFNDRPGCHHISIVKSNGIPDDGPSRDGPEEILAFLSPAVGISPAGRVALTSLVVLTSLAALIHLQSLLRT